MSKDKDRGKQPPKPPPRQGERLEKASVPRKPTPPPPPPQKK